MPRVAVFFLVAAVCLSVFSEIVGMRGGGGSPGRRSRSRTPPSPAPRTAPTAMDRFRSVARGLMRSVSPRRRDNLGASSSRRSVARSRSQSPEPPFPYLRTTITAKNQNDVEVIAVFASMARGDGDWEMTLAEFRQRKSSMTQKANQDQCLSDRKNGGLKCVQALKEMQRIPRDWRGPCGNTFAAMCHQWPAPDGWKCSFFMKTSASDTAPIQGYVHRMSDCANALVPDQYERHLQGFADSLIKSEPSSP